MFKNRIDQVIASEQVIELRLQGSVVVCDMRMLLRTVVILFVCLGFLRSCLLHSDVYEVFDVHLQLFHAAQAVIHATQIQDLPLVRVDRTYQFIIQRYFENRRV